MTKTVIHWFRKGLRVHDNPALCDAITVATDKTYMLRPIFILDPLIVTWMKIGPNRWRFLQQSLTELNNQLQTLGSRLYVVRGKPEEVFPKVFKDWQVTLLTFELDIEPFSIERDRIVEKIAKNFHVEIKQCVSHTIYNTELILAKNLGKPPLTYQKFLSVAESLGKVKEPLPAPLAIPDFCLSSNDDERYDVPSLKELGVDESQLGECKYPGGETEALKRLNRYMKQQKWVCNFEKPNTSPNTLEPSTTVLSPYLKFGCLSSKLFYQRLKQVTNNTKHSKPPVSLLGQLLWREFYYACASAIPNFDKMSGNTICCQIPWDTNESHLTAWKNGQTGYPFIDAIMRQLKQEGWIHHLARHAVACFLTRGDLWISWEEGQKVFEEYLLDADWALNAGNWMWLSASAFFHQFFRVYSPVAFGKKTDKTGEYIRKYVPEIKKFSPEYIYEPWNAPLSVQQTAGCIVGKDYPKRIVVHEDVYKVNIGKMTAAYKENKAMKGEVSASKRLQSEEPKPKEANKKAKKGPQKGNKKGNEKGKKDSQTGSIIKFLKK